MYTCGLTVVIERICYVMLCYVSSGFVRTFKRSYTLYNPLYKPVVQPVVKCIRTVQPAGRNILNIRIKINKQIEYTFVELCN